MLRTRRHGQTEKMIWRWFRFFFLDNYNVCGLISRYLRFPVRHKCDLEKHDQKKFGDYSKVALRWGKCFCIYRKGLVTDEWHVKSICIFVPLLLSWFFLSVVHTHTHKCRMEEKNASVGTQGLWAVCVPPIQSSPSRHCWSQETSKW